MSSCAAGGLWGPGSCAGCWPAGLLATADSNETKPRPAGAGAAERTADTVGVGAGLVDTTARGCCLGTGLEGKGAAGNVIAAAGRGTAGIVARGSLGSSAGTVAPTTESALSLCSTAGIGTGTGSDG